jgi:hypothetical protein
MIYDFIKNLSTVIKNLDLEYSKFNHQHIYNELFLLNSISDVEQKSTFDNFGEDHDYSFQFKDKLFYILNSRNETMCPVKQDYYFHYRNNRQCINNMPFLIVYDNHLYMVVIDQSGTILEYYQAQDPFILPIEHYIQRNGSTFVNYNNNNNIEFRLISETPNYKTNEERLYNVIQVQAIDLFLQVKVSGF